MPVILILLGVVAALGVAGLLLILAFLIAPEWFSKSCSTTMGMLVGMGAAGIIVVIVLCACLGVTLAFVLTVAGGL